MKTLLSKVAVNSRVILQEPLNSGYKASTENSVVINTSDSVGFSHNYPAILEGLGYKIEICTEIRAEGEDRQIDLISILLVAVKIIP